MLLSIFLAKLLFASYIGEVLMIEQSLEKSKS
jgi:hypothetical protein